MKPCSFRARHSSNLLQPTIITPTTVIGGIKGSVKKLGTKYSQALVVLYNKADLLPIALRKPDANGNYQFLGLNTDLTCFIVALDSQHQYNAVIQDMVVPK